MSDELLKYVIEIKEDVAEIKANLEDLPQVKARVTALETENTKIQTTLKVVKRIAYGAVGLPSVAFALVKVVEFLKN